ncbi:MAG: amidohydrolase family protein [Planctomycetota bacterium]|nr:amidohydrolase family protein [Planctomycetota bacterium]
MNESNHHIVSPVRPVVVDAHLHVWKSDPSFPDPSVTPMSPTSDIRVELLDQYMDEHRVNRAVLVQPLYPGEDNSYVAHCATRQPERFCAVCVVDSGTPKGVDQLSYWVTEKGCRGLRLRPVVESETPHFNHPATFAMWEKVESLGVVVSILMNPSHLTDLEQLLQRFTTVPVLVDHMGLPNLEDGTGTASIKALCALAKYRNLHVKVSGHYSFSQQSYPYQDCDEMFRQLVEHFGPSRLIWGSDFPHVLLHCGYRRARYQIERSYPSLSSEDMDAIMGNNALSLYWP